MSDVVVVEADEVDWDPVDVLTAAGAKGSVR